MHSNTLNTPSNPPVLFNFFEVSKDGHLIINAAVIRIEIQNRLSEFYHQHSNSLTLKSALLEPERDAFIHDCTQFFESINSIKKNIFMGIQQYLGEAQYQSTEKEISENISIYLIDALNHLISIENNRIFKSSMISKKDVLSSCIDTTYLKIDQTSTLFDDGDYNLDSPTIKSKILAISPASEKFNQIHYLLGIFKNSHDDELAPKAGHGPSFDEIRGLHLFSAIICHQIILGNSSNTNIITYTKRFLTDSSFSNLLKDYDFEIYNLRKNNYINHTFCMGSMLCSLIQLDEDVLSKFLIKMGYSLLQTDQLQRTPLHLAVLRKNYELIELIKKYSIGSRYASFFTLVSQRDRSSYRKTAFDYALINQDIKAMSLLFHENLFFASSFERATFVNPLHRVASIPNFNQDILNFLFKKNVYLDPQDLKERASPAMIAYKNHQYSVAQNFIAAGASVVLTDINGESLIFYAIQHALSDEIAAEHVSLILDKKSWFDNLDIVSTNRETNLKKTPLMLAFELQYFKACSLLIDKGFSKIVNGEDKILNIPKKTLGKIKELIKENKTDDALDLYGTLINERLFINEYLLTNQYFQNMARSRFSFFNFFFNFFFSSFFSFSHNLNSIGRVNYSARLKMLKKNVKIRFAEQLVEHDDSMTPHSIENSPSLILPSKVRKITINHDSLNTEFDDRLAHRQ